MSAANFGPQSSFPLSVSAEEWRGVARGLHSHLARTGRRQKDLAAAAGMALSNLSAYLNLHRIPSPRTIARILSAAARTQGITLAMVEHWMHQPDSVQAGLQERVAELAELGIELTPQQRERLLAVAAGDRQLGGSFLRLAEEIRALRTRCAQLAMAHTDAARESLVQSAVEAFQVDPKMAHFTREVERDVRRVHLEERRQHATPMEMLGALLAREGIRIERAEASSPRSGRGRWEGMRWLLSLKDNKRATITTGLHPDQYPFELGRVVGHLRMNQLFGASGQEEVEAFASRWVEENFPQAAADPGERGQLEQDIIWLIFRSLSGRWATGLFTLPADRFVRLAEQHQYDFDRLAAELAVPFETVLNRASQMDTGLPVHFIKMDWRGVVLKRSSYSGLQFAPLYMRVCGRWASARSLIASPGSFFRQFSTFPDLSGQTYFCVGRAVNAPAMRFGSAPLVYSLTIGVQARDAQRLIYAQEFTNPPVECGVTCRLCTVLNCENRVCPAASLPGIGKFDFNVIWSGKTIHERIPTEG
jgi:transcriptional regulator with XRE-family HTH domain